jgi:hypothetical protein
MATPASIPLRAPGVYPWVATPLQTLTGVRMDVCAFCGVAPRGPVRVPVVNEKWPDSRPCVEAERPIDRTRAYAVESFTEYQRLYGGFEGPGLLPYAVASFFEQGGQRAYIARIVHDYGAGDPRNDGRFGNLTTLSLLTAADATGGNTVYTAAADYSIPVGTSVVIAGFTKAGNNGTFTVRSVSFSSITVNNPGGVAESNPAATLFANMRVASGTVPGATTTAGDLVMRARNEGSWGNLLQATLSFQASPIAFISATATQLVFDANAEIQAGALLRLTLAGGTRVLRFVSALVWERIPDGPGSRIIAILGFPAGSSAVSAEVITGTLNVDDGSGRTEEHTALGLSAQHPRWMATVLCNESSLLYPGAAWIDADITPNNINLDAAVPSENQFQGGEDGWADITPEDFFDPNWTVDNEDPGQGVQCLALLSDLSVVVAPDLYSPAPLAPVENIIDPVSLAGPEFQICEDPPPTLHQEHGSYDLSGLRLDPRDPADLRQITALQQQLVVFAEAVRSFVVLLDVPPGLSQQRILHWRTAFDSSYAACYHPWLQVSRRDDSRNHLVLIPPSAAAAGIIAAIAIQSGVPTGPANVLAAQVINVADVVSPQRHDALHPRGINVYLHERDGVRLTAARTLSLDPQYRQLSVRRLVILIRKTLEQEMQWVVFEPNNASLQLELRLLLESFLRALFKQGAFRGVTESDSFFVRCDETVNPPFITDAGRLIAEIGIAPDEPIEFILLRLSRDGDGTLSVQD